MNNKYLVIGSGLTGLIMARFIKKYRDKNAEVTVIEKDEEIGGLFSSKKYDHGYFDYGMHIYYECCIPEIDNLVYDALPKNEWHIMPGNEKDIAGIFVNGKLQLTTPYVDLRDYPENKKASFISDLFLTIAQNDAVGDDDNAYQLLKKHFGKLITEEIFLPVFKKLYYCHPNLLSPLALDLTAVDRVALFDSLVMADLMKSDIIRSRICYPDQFNLPPYRKNAQRGLYPEKYGMIRVIDGLKKLMLQEGIESITHASVTNILVDKNKIKEVEIQKESKKISFTNITKVIWTAGIPPLSTALGNDHSGIEFDPRPPSYFINFLFNKPLKMGKLYYFYCFDKGYNSFRVTNYYNYCKDAFSERGCPACVEFWLNPGDSFDDQSLIKKSLDELNAFGVIDASYEILFAKAERCAGFPIPSVKNANSLEVIRKKIENKKISNLITAGVMAKKNLFFISDILKDAYNALIKD